jgi:hypothetical protein
LASFFCAKFVSTGEAFSRLVSAAGMPSISLIESIKEKPAALAPAADRDKKTMAIAVKAVRRRAIVGRFWRFEGIEIVAPVLDSKNPP